MAYRASWLIKTGFDVLCKTTPITRVPILKNHNSTLLRPFSVLPQRCSSVKELHTSQPRADLMEFFDDKDTWPETAVKRGRPWRKDELRIKSNTDLHKLWYVLLKERNIVMTMEAEYTRLCELMPNPERLEKCEESMENLLEVVAERDRAYHLLETGETGEPGIREAVNLLGLRFPRRCQEHYMPFKCSRMSRSNRMNGPWQDKYKKLLREKLMLRAGRFARRGALAEKERKEAFIPKVGEYE